MSDLVIILNKQVESLERKLAEKFEEVARLKSTIHDMNATIVRLQSEANRNMEELCRARAEKKDEYCQGCALPGQISEARNKQRIDERQCDDMTRAAAVMAVRIKELEADALVMALRLLGEDDITFGPECYEVMQKWGPIAMAAIGGNGMVAGGLSPDKRR